jgi:hypothetical protein
MPSGNIDVAPTVLSILGVTPTDGMDGRVLFEAMTGEQPSVPKPIEDQIEAGRSYGFLRWHQYLKLTHVGYTVYYDEGNGQCQLQQD